MLLSLKIDDGPPHTRATIFGTKGSAYPITPELLHAMRTCPEPDPPEDPSAKSYWKPRIQDPLLAHTNTPKFNDMGFLMEMADGTYVLQYVETGSQDRVTAGAPIEARPESNSSCPHTHLLSDKRRLADRVCFFCWRPATSLFSVGRIPYPRGAIMDTLQGRGVRCLPFGELWAPLPDPPLLQV